MALAGIAHSALVPDTARLDLFAHVSWVQVEPTLASSAPEIIVGEAVLDLAVVLLHLEGLKALHAFVLDLLLAPQNFIFQTCIVNQTEILLAFRACLFCFSILVFIKIGYALFYSRLAPSVFEVKI